MSYKIHYNTYLSEDEPIEKHCCGVIPSDEFYYNPDKYLTRDWNEVTCKKCLKAKENITKWENETEKHIQKEYGEMAKSFAENNLIVKEV